ncbi:MAG: hypothetical protein A2X86_19830 [Bdellovibrionales bacterium GWA2_49_15]|nr:MAG: hypothetical protein A2X86_19830 [Bdellovibrionales bacterium GWA2_49_15]HAZ12511.1 hypothetical protein [Bdellovibrionales bacterium]
MERDGKSYQLEYNAVGEKSPRLFNIQIWRVEDVAQFLGCSKGHIYNLVNVDKIPTRKKGKFLYFIPSEIVSWVLQGD